MKYTVDSLRPRLDQFLNPLIAHASLALSYELRSSENPHPEVENPDVTVNFAGEDVELLLANRGELLLALEHLSMEAIRLPAEDHSLLSFDANDYRLLRVEELRMSALAAAEKVKSTHVPFHFNPMSSRERRIIHLSLRNETDVRSESTGAGPHRQVVILPPEITVVPDPIIPPPPREEREGGREGGFRGRDGRRDGGRDRGPRRSGPPRGRR